MKLTRITNLIAAGLISIIMVSCNSDEINNTLKNGSAGSGDSLYSPSKKAFKDPKAVVDTIAPIQVDSSGEQTGRMNNTGKG